MTVCVQMSNNEFVPQLHEVLNVESHPSMSPTWLVCLSDLYKLHVNVIMGDLVQLLASV
jgi:hypothetical protein